MSADFTFDPGLAFDDTTLTPVKNATGVLRDEAGGSVQPVYDLLGNPLSGLSTNGYGYVARFKADIGRGVLDFGSVTQPVISYELIDAAASAASSGGGMGRTTIANPTSLAQAVSGSGKVLTASTFTFTDQVTGAASTDLVDFAASGLAMAAAGWWQLSVQANIGFTAGSTALPDHFMVAFGTYYDVIEVDAMVPCTPPPGYSAGRSIHGGQGRVTSHVFYQEDSATTGGSIQPRIYWPGDATAKSPTGGTTPFVRVFATRLG